ncbi:hypothetical protein [Pseudoalteromonas sp. GABNS16H]|uniref:hypothetical protein n=1 Tax=Pseudoalteromonas sp. GABNS16H TaxID=3025325 RepID=UPI00235E3D7F|nr:hypothetical protein [Pseudoalteromonas sp. GABNS16H]MDC9611555.1 hypothetical protein [Pseudoalteromonas sp. GABNS16H]
MAKVSRKNFYWAATSAFALLWSGIPLCVEVVIAAVVLLTFPELTGQFELTLTLIIIWTFVLLIANWIPTIALLHRRQLKGGGPMPIGDKGLSGYIDVPEHYHNEQ